MKTLTIILSILRVAFIGDPQVDNATELRYAQQSIYSELRERKDLDLVIVLGDLVNDKPELIAPSKASLDSLPCPWICAPGNHDKDVYRGRKLPRDTRTFRDVLGYVDTCFTMNGIRFISMDDVRTVERAGYEGGLGESQKEWLRHALDGARGPVVLCAHIPFSECKGRDSLSAILEPVKDRLLMVCGHTHNVWRGPSGYGCEEVQAGATCGSWWRGIKDEHGIPDALMNCGAPRGYFIADFKAGRSKWYRLSYKCVGQSADRLLSASVMDGKLYVNVFGGSTEGKAKIRIKGRWIELERAEESTPEVIEVIDRNKAQTREYRKANKDEFIPMRRLPSPHLWKTDLPETRSLRIRYSDPSCRFRTRCAISDSH